MVLPEVYSSLTNVVRFLKYSFFNSGVRCFFQVGSSFTFMAIRMIRMKAHPNDPNKGLCY